MYGITYLTSNGQTLLAKAMEGKILQFTRFAVGSGTISDITNIKSLTGLVELVSYFNIAKISRNNAQIEVRGIFKNTDVDEDFYLRELGLYAKDPDTSQEVLFAYINYGDKAEYINTADTERVERYYNMIISVDNAETINLVVNSTISYATEQELNQEVLYRYNLTLDAANWVMNSTSNYYEYTVTDSNVTSDTRIELYPNLLNQKKMNDGEVNSYNGYYVISTTELPEENIEFTVYYQLSHSIGGN